MLLERTIYDDDRDLLSSVIKKGHDVKIYCGEGDDVKIFFGHSLLLCARSTYFRSVLTRWVKKEGNKFVINLPDIHPDAFKIILE